MAIANFKRRMWAQAVKLVRECPLLIEVVDARDINGTRIYKLDRGYRGKLILAATKADLTNHPIGECKEETDGSLVVYCSARTPHGMDGMKQALKERIAKVIEKHPSYGDKRVDRVMDILIYGIPNVGKSSLINALTGRRAAPTGFKAGITRGPTWVALSPRVRLVDMPGLVDTDLKAEDMALHAALDVEKLYHPEEAAVRIIRRYLDAKDPDLFGLYEIPEADTAEAVLEAVARRMGKMLPGGEPNTLEAAKMVLRDWQRGKLKWVDQSEREREERYMEQYHADEKRAAKPVRGQVGRHGKFVRRSARFDRAGSEAGFGRPGAEAGAGHPEGGSARPEGDIPRSAEGPSDLPETVSKPEPPSPKVERAARLGILSPDQNTADRFGEGPRPWEKERAIPSRRPGPGVSGARRFAQGARRNAPREESAVRGGFGRRSGRRGASYPRQGGEDEPERKRHPGLRERGGWAPKKQSRGRRPKKTGHMRRKF